MNQPLDSDRRDALKRAFRLPSMRTITSRKTSITHVFASAIIPQVIPSLEEIDEALAVLGIDLGRISCVYCGDDYTEWDHLRPVVVKRRATGFISEIGNLVPACGKCNQSKGNKPWREWMVSAAPRSPQGRQVAKVADRMDRLEAFERWRKPICLDVEAIIGKPEWDRYWGLCDSVIAEMQSAQLVAEDIKRRVAERLPAR